MVSDVTEAKPLDLEGIKEKIIEDCRKENFTTESYPAIHFIIDTTIKEIEQRIRSASEFYLLYCDKPNFLVKDYPKLKAKVKKVTKESDLFGLLAIPEYNEWLFKLAFGLREDEDENNQD